MTFLNEIIQQHPEAGYWHQQYPWFSIGQFVHLANQKDTLAFQQVAPQAAVFFNDILRLHWLVHQEDTDRQNLLVGSGSERPEKEDAPVTTVSPTEEQTAISQQDTHQTVSVAAIAMGTNTAPSPTPQFTIDLSAEPEDEEQEMNEDVIIENEAPLPASPLSQTLAQVANNFKEQPTDESLLFETAYQHTIDYFASQGIKLEGEPARDDRFGQQLKTFTSWLRQMKRLPSTTEQETDPVVETHAAHSLQKGDVLTEPMADVLLKQGKQAQAIILLEKLRLLYPEKSLYFAARIDQVKNTK